MVFTASFYFGQQHEGVQQIALRTAIVMGKGGALVPIKNLAKMGFGGKQGSGCQMVSWIHIEDLFRIIRYLETHENLHKIYNCAAPNPINNKDFMKAVRQSLHIKRGLATPELLLKMGAVLIRTEPEMVLKSRWVLPERLIDEGFEFKFLKIEEALGEL